MAADIYFTGRLTKVKLREIYPQAFTGRGKLKNYQLNIDESVTTAAQPTRRIPLSRREKVVQKLKELEILDVIEKVEGFTQWVNPLVTVEKPNRNVRVSRHARSKQSHNKGVEETVQEIGK